MNNSVRIINGKSAQRHTEITVEENSEQKILYFNPPSLLTSFGASSLRAKGTTAGGAADKSDTFLRIRLRKDSKLYLWNLHFTKNSEKYACEIIFEGENAFAETYTIYCGAGEGTMALSNTHLLCAPNGVSRITAYGILSGKAYAQYNGTIEISKEAANSDVSLNEKTLLLGRRAKANIIPQLKIATNDIKASHSAGISTIDDEELFYAACRGLKKRNAVNLISKGFLKPLIKNIPDAAVMKRAGNLTEKFLCR